MLLLLLLLLASYKPDEIYILTNVAITQDVPLDGTFFFSNAGQKDKATFMDKIFL